MGFGKNIRFQALPLLGAGPQLVLRDTDIFEASRGIWKKILLLRFWFLMAFVGSILGLMVPGHILL